jgi:hypothetical protein
LHLAHGEPRNAQAQHIGEVVPGVAEQRQAVDRETRCQLDSDEEAVEQDGPAQATDRQVWIPVGGVSFRGAGRPLREARGHPSHSGV